jgi:hypothetical protein
VSDFFGNLAASVCDRSRFVRPRLPCIFESPSDLAAPHESRTEIDATETREKPQVERTPITAEVRGFESRPLEPVAHKVDARAPIRDLSVVESPIVRKQSMPLPSRSEGAPPAPAMRRSIPAVVRREGSDDMLDAVSTRAKVRPERSVEVPVVTQMPAQDAPVVAPITNSERRVSKEHPMNGTAQTVGPFPTVAKLRPPAPSAVTLARAAPESARRARVAPPAETTVHVSIGRIEVRAVPPPIARSPRASKPAVMGLDEYLRSRAESRR